MRKALTIITASALAFGAAACSKSETANNTATEDNMLVPADENTMGGDMNMAMDNSMDTNMAMDNSSNAM